MYLNDDVAERWRQLCGDGPLSIGTAAGCVATAANGSLAKSLILESLSIVGMSISGYCYLLLEIANLKASASRRPHVSNLLGPVWCLNCGQTNQDVPYATSTVTLLQWNDVFLLN